MKNLGQTFKVLDWHPKCGTNTKSGDQCQKCETNIKSEGTNNGTNWKHTYTHTHTHNHLFIFRLENCMFYLKKRLSISHTSLSLVVDSRGINKRKSVRM